MYSFRCNATNVIHFFKAFQMGKVRTSRWSVINLESQRNWQILGGLKHRSLMTNQRGRQYIQKEIKLLLIKVDSYSSGTQLTLSCLVFISFNIAEFIRPWWLLSLRDVSAVLNRNWFQISDR